MARDAADDPLIELLQEGLSTLGGVSFRRMFGGWGIFRDGLMFGLIIDDQLYLRSDDGNRPAFEAEGLSPFTYDKRDGKTTVMSYWRAPERLLDDPDELRAWADQAIAATRRIAAAKTVKAKRAAPRPSVKEAGSTRRRNKP